MTVDENKVVDEVQNVDVEDSESDIDDVPAELQGLSEEVIKEIMAEADNKDYEPEPEKDYYEEREMERWEAEMDRYGL